MQGDLFGDSLPQQDSTKYLALARRYRPVVFSELIGQDFLKKTLSNAFKSGRLSHAFILTGIRGVGKTTTARIIAKALNCQNLSEDFEPCNECDNCKSISSGIHQDVLEIDAASNTSVDDIREIIDNVRYKPISGTYKVYIIDEVHMLSKSAFNALLKTLEEPPAHVKFIFATTEVRKIPVTVLSRCQRFDLRRLNLEELINYFKYVVEKEEQEADIEALTTIANVANGSVRDGLSILDQSLVISEGKLTVEHVQDILGIADVTETYKCFYTLVKGEIGQTLNKVTELFDKGADPILLTQDLLKICNLITRSKISSAKSSNTVPEGAKEIFEEMVTNLETPFLCRCFQMLERGLGELAMAYDPYITLEMLLIRIAHANTETTLEDLLASGSSSCSSNKNSGNKINTFEDILKLCVEKNKTMMYHHLKNDVKIVNFSLGELKISLPQHINNAFINEVRTFLTKESGQEWQVTKVDNDNSSLTHREQEQMIAQHRQDEIKQNELVQSALNVFTDAKITDIK